MVPFIQKERAFLRDINERILLLMQFLTKLSVTNLKNTITGFNKIALIVLRFQ